jgi:hypothetical protein
MRDGDAQGKPRSRITGNGGFTATMPAIPIHAESLRVPKPGRSRCEDVTGGLDRTWWLMDGATGVIAPEEVCDSGWFAETIQASFLSQLALNPAVPLDTLIAQATRFAADRFADLAPREMRDHPPWWPSSTLVLVRVHSCLTDQTPDRMTASPGEIAAEREGHDVPGAELEVRMAGDSDLAIVSRNGQVRTVRDNRHTQYCSDLYRDVLGVLREGAGYESARFREALAAAVTVERENRNRPATYQVLAPEPFLPGNALSATIPLIPGDRIVLLSDGAARGHALFGLQEPDDALRDFAHGDLWSTLHRVRAAEDADYHGQQSPRGTRHDDATVLRLRMG